MDGMSLIKVGARVISPSAHVGGAELAVDAMNLARAALKDSDPAAAVLISLRREGGRIVGFDVAHAMEGNLALTKAVDLWAPVKFEGDAIALVSNHGHSMQNLRGWSGLLDDRPDLLEGVTNLDVVAYARQHGLGQWI